jgi:8-oxo-dGTP diphosphatase
VSDGKVDPSPVGPKVGVGAVLFRGDLVLLIRRGKEPLKGTWLIPGGTVELGETLEEALVREVMEETGVATRPGPMIAAFDRILRSRSGEVSYHYVILDYLCEWAGGEARAGSDAADVTWARIEQLSDLGVPEEARKVIEEGLRRRPVALESKRE